MKTKEPAQVDSGDSTKNKNYGDALKCSLNFCLLFKIFQYREAFCLVDFYFLFDAVLATYLEFSDKILSLFIKLTLFLCDTFFSINNEYLAMVEAI